MWLHRSNLGSFGDQLPADRDGYVRYDRRKVSAIVQALEEGRDVPPWACTGNNLAVAEAEWALWRWFDGGR